jgi:hypothetical protein
MIATRKTHGYRLLRGVAWQPVITSAIALACACFSGCATESVRVTPAHIARPSIGELELSGIELESLYSYTESRAEIESVIVASAGRAGIAIDPINTLATTDATVSDDHASDRETISFFIREQGYTKGYKAMLSLAIIAELRDRAGNTVLRAEYFHDGEESFDSMGFLTGALDATFKKIARATRKAG